MEVFILNDKLNFNRLISEYFSIDPTMVDGTGNLTFNYYRRYLYQLVFSRFKFNDLPEAWDIDYIRDTLFQWGYMGIVRTEVGTMALQCGYSGVNYALKPTQIIISNPVFGIFNRRIGLNGELLYFEYLNQCFNGMENIIKRYALLLAQCDSSLNVNLMNSRVAMAITGSNKRAINSAKKMYDEVTRGNPAVFALWDKEAEINTTLFNNVKNSYVGNDLLQTKQTIMNEFRTIIGLNNSNTEKRERLVTDEAHANDETTRTLIEMWCDNLNQCFDRVREWDPTILTTVSINYYRDDVKESDIDESV